MASDDYLLGHDDKELQRVDASGGLLFKPSALVGCWARVP